MIDNLYSKTALGSFAPVRDRRRAAQVAAARTEKPDPVRVIENGGVYTKVEGRIA